jgi:hypothetical protein
VEHSGSIRGGHYTAHVLTHANRKQSSSISLPLSLSLGREGEGELEQHLDQDCKAKGTNNNGEEINKRIGIQSEGNEATFSVARIRGGGEATAKAEQEWEGLRKDPSGREGEEHKEEEEEEEEGKKGKRTPSCLTCAVGDHVTLKEEREKDGRKGKEKHSKAGTAAAGTTREPLDEDGARAPLVARRWVHVSDNTVTLSSQDKATRAQAYLLYYSCLL